MHLPISAFAPRLPPHLPLGSFPSPVEEHPRLAAGLGLASLVIKRDDLTGSRFGGNKLRALEWLLPAAGSAIVTMGGYGSTWCAALASAGRSNGRSVHAALFPQPWSPTVAGALSVTVSEGRVSLAGSRAALPLAVGRAWLAARREGPVSWLPAGGATPLAVLGSANAALEFVTQQAESGIRLPDAIVVPFGSGATAAGLLIGMRLAGWEGTVCAVRVVEPWFATSGRVLALVRRTVRLLSRSGARVPVGSARLRVVSDQLGGGYGHPTPAGIAAQAMLAGEGITVDLTYGAKAWAALAGLAASFPHLCFWHTFDTRLAPGHSREDSLLREARARAETLWPHQKLT